MEFEVAERVREGLRTTQTKDCRRGLIFVNALYQGETTMTRAPTASDESKPIAERKAGVDPRAGQPTWEQDKASVYAAYWQARAGLLTEAPKTNRGQPQPGEE